MTKSIDIKIEAARRRAQAELDQHQTGATFDSAEQRDHLRNIGAPGQQSFEDTQPAADMLAERACLQCGCDVDPSVAYAIAGQTPYCGDCWLATPGPIAAEWGGPDDGSADIWDRVP